MSDISERALDAYLKAAESVETERNGMVRGYLSIVPDDMRSLIAEIRRARKSPTPPSDAVLVPRELLKSALFLMRTEAGPQFVSSLRETDEFKKLRALLKE